MGVTLLLLPSFGLKCYFVLPVYCGYNFVQDHVEGYLALSGKTKTYFATAVSLWDADFYVKVDDDVHVNIGKISIFMPFTAPRLGAK